MARGPRRGEDCLRQGHAAVKGALDTAAAAPIAARAQAVGAVPDKIHAGGGFDLGEAPAVGDLENRRGGGLEKVAGVC